MGRPQQPELARSGKTELDPDSIGTELEGRRPVRSGGATGPVPDENQPGHHPGREQDKPDLDAFAAKLGADDPPKAAKAAKTRKQAQKQIQKRSPAATAPRAPKAARPASKPKATKGTDAAAAAAATKPAAASRQTATRPTPSGAETPASVTPLKQPAAAPRWPESAPPAERAGGNGNRDGASEPEPPVVRLAMLPLRMTVRSLEHLERQLSERWRRRLG